MSDLFWWSLALFLALPAIGFVLVKFRGTPPGWASELGITFEGGEVESPAVQGETPQEIEPEPIKKREKTVLSRSTIGLAVVELQQEFAVTEGAPKIRRRRVIVVTGYVTTEADARALGDALKNYATELP